ncbi:hypothetical protein CGJ94_17985 [Vibrio parahaemolyticus]|nr:hypothetical protein CGK06_23710 [Vibrio parahaemolyticus]TOC16054.1 hypothetical protein CGJ94_17985 [Vibrio parahaemolyticus]
MIDSTVKGISIERNVFKEEEYNAVKSDFLTVIFSASEGAFLIIVVCGWNVFSIIVAKAEAEKTKKKTEKKRTIRSTRKKKGHQPERLMALLH